MNAKGIFSTIRFFKLLKVFFFEKIIESAAYFTVENEYYNIDIECEKYIYKLNLYYNLYIRIKYCVINIHITTALLVT